jgi:hypothetical protein
VPLTPCAKVLNCCGRTPCCPGTVLPDTLDAVVTSSCPPLNGTLTLTRHGGANDPPCWTGRATVGGCHNCTILQVDLCCKTFATGTGTGLAYHWDLGFTVFESDGVTLCVISAADSGASLTETCGPPLHVTYSAADLNLTDPSTGVTCCFGFTITVDVLGPT